MTEPASREVLLHGWGRTAPSRARVLRPAGVADVVAACSDVVPRGLLARGLGRSYGDAAQNAGGTVLDTSRLDELAPVDPDDETVTVGAGVSMNTLVRAALPAGRFPPVVPGTQWVSLGGALAADVHGKNHHVDGSFADHVTSFELVTGTGEVRTVRPGEPAFAATAGGMGLSGVITRLTVRLRRVTTAYLRVRAERADDLDDCLDRLTREDPAHPYSVAWVDCLAPGRRLGRSVLTSGAHANRADLPARWRADPLQRRYREPRAYTAITVPPLPIALLTASAVRAFNSAWFARAGRGGTSVQPVASFFWPLDGVAGWNRLYGPRGFVQYQFVVPVGAEQTLYTVVRRLRAAHCPPYLAVLKRLGPGNGHPLSFPRAGWTFALDLPAAAPGLAQVLHDLDDEVAAAAGRVYLAKDARLRPDLLTAMYPQLEQWRRMRADLDPGGVFASDLGRRLGLIPRPDRGAARGTTGGTTGSATGGTA